ncbi:MAG: histidine kinase [Rhodospirillaceae bacterium BRH_c57]|nr:MAG: histidine kinase [Rhodospirillaceae bacterium BRH_c57]
MPDDCTILIVEDDALIAQSLKLTVEDLGYVVCGVADNATLAVEIARRERPKVVLMDVRLRGRGDGVDAALTMHGEGAPLIIFITGSNEPEMRERISQDHASALLIKPILPNQLEDALRQVLAGT